MGALRDFFSKVGFCESTADLEKRPALIDHIVKYSSHYVDTKHKFGVEDPYEDRLRFALSDASTYALQRIVDEQVIVCMDKRLNELDLGFWDDVVYAAYYEQKGKKVISLFDTGSLKSSWFHVDTGDYSASAIEDLVDEVLDDKNYRPDMLIGTTHSRYNAATKTTTTYFKWHEEEDFESELSKNPELKDAPLKQGPINVPRYGPSN